jgi:hypothetical protein
MLTDPIQQICPHCGHNAFRMLEGAVDGAECLRCHKLFSLQKPIDPQPPQDMSET